MTDLIFACTSDLAGKTRGKAFPAEQRDKRLLRGVGWVPTNVQINCFDAIADSPFGSLGDLLLVPDPNTEVAARFGNQTERFMLGDIVALDGKPWEFCTRALLKSALERLRRVANVNLLAAFEHEFQFRGENLLKGEAFARSGFEARREFCETLMAQIAKAGFKPDSIMKEFGPNQYEVVIGPEPGIRAADAAVIVRELARSSARHLGESVSFAPILDPDSVGNGVHIHMSFLDEGGKPATHDPNGLCGMSDLTSSFSAGVLKYLDSILALTAPSVISYLRLTPHRWSAAYNNLGFRDREASLRVCPVTAQDPASIEAQFNIEYRAADAAASPHLALAAVIHAGIQGIEDGLEAPDPTQEDLSQLSSEALAKRGFVRLPETLDAALEKLSGNTTVCGWFSEDFVPVYCAHKRSEIEFLKDMDMGGQCAAYQETY